MASLLGTCGVHYDMERVERQESTKDRQFAQVGQMGMPDLSAGSDGKNILFLCDRRPDDNQEGAVTNFRVELRTLDESGAEAGYHGLVEAPNVLNAVGQACIRFGVRTDTLTYLVVEAQDKPEAGD